MAPEAVGRMWRVKGAPTAQQHPQGSTDTRARPFLRDARPRVKPRMVPGWNRAGKRLHNAALTSVQERRKNSQAKL